MCIIVGVTYIYDATEFLKATNKCIDRFQVSKFRQAVSKRDYILLASQRPFSRPINEYSYLGFSIYGHNIYKMKRVGLKTALVCHFTILEHHLKFNINVLSPHAQTTQKFKPESICIQ